MCAACLNSPAGWWPFGFMFACLCWPRALSPQQLQIQHIWSCWASFGWSNTRNVVSWFFGGGGCSDHFIAGGVTQRGFPCVMHSTASVVWSSAVSLKGVWILFPFTAFKKTKIQGNSWLSAACLLSWERSCLCDTKQRLFSHPLTIKGGDGSSSQIFRLRLHFVTKTRA